MTTTTTLTVVIEPFWSFQEDRTNTSPEIVFAIFGNVFHLPRRHITYVCIHEIIEALNTHPEPINNFRVLTKDVPKASSPNDSLIGWVHNHSQGERGPSHNDIKGIAPGLYGAVWCDGSTAWYNHRGLLRSRYLS